jgi:hypothetical protein
MDVKSPAPPANWKFKTGSKYRSNPDNQHLLSRLKAVFPNAGTDVFITCHPGTPMCASSGGCRHEQRHRFPESIRAQPAPIT